MPSAFWYMLLALLALVGDARPTFAQFLGPIVEAQLSPHVAVDEIDNDVRRQLERYRQLLADKNWDEAIDLIGRLIENDGDKLAPAPVGERRKPLFTRYVPLRRECQRRLALLAREAPEALRAYRDRVDPLAERWFVQAKAERDDALLERIVDQFFVSRRGDDAMLLLADAAIERGDFVAARRLLQQITPTLRSPAAGLAIWLPLRKVDWSVDRDAVRRALLESAAPSAAPLAYPDTDLPLADVAARMALVSILEQSQERAAVELEYLRQIYPDAVGTLGGREGRWVDLLETLREQSVAWSPPASDADWPTFAGEYGRNRIASRPLDLPGAVAWSVDLIGYRGEKDRLAARHGRVAEESTGLLSCHPSVVGENVFVADSRRIRAFRLQDGRPVWPTTGPIAPAGAAADSPSASAGATLNAAPNAAQNATRNGAPAGTSASDPPAEAKSAEPPSSVDVDAGVIYRTSESDGLSKRFRFAGSPRFTVSIDRQRLLARVGPPVTRRDEDEMPTHQEQGFLIGLDLAAQGRVFLRLSPAEIGLNADWAFEGSPVSDGGRLYVALRRRDAVRDQAHVAAFDLRTGKQAWRRQVSAAEPPHRFLPGISHSLLTLRDDTLYFNTNLGAIAAISARDGRILWLTAYPRAAYAAADPDKTDRHFLRDLNPCLVHQDLVVAAPSDCDRLFALDAATGQLVWTTDGDRAIDVMHLLGVAAGRLVASGDYLYWFDVYSGAPVGQYPSARKEGPGFVRPTPRGYGRGVLVGDQVWWPTRDKILAFRQETRRDRGAWLPIPVREIDLTSRNATGGNLVVAGDVLLIASDQRLTAFHAAPSTPAKKP